MRAAPARADDIFVELTNDYALKVTRLAGGLVMPWGMAFLPGGDIILTERAGRMRLFSGGALAPAPLTGVPKVLAAGFGGLLDVQLHPQFAQNSLVYFTYSAGTTSRNWVVLARGTFTGTGLTGVRTLFSSTPTASEARFIGCRIAFTDYNALYIGIGDHAAPANVQRLDNHDGKILRLTLDGKALRDNPFYGQPGAKPEIYALGVRNPEGMVWHQPSRRLYESEHGPQGGDEINIVKRAANYGWPDVSWGCNYGANPCEPIGGGRKAGTRQPIKHWEPSIATAGIDFCTSDLFPLWRGNLLVAALKGNLVSRLTLASAGNVVTAEEQFLKGRIGRIRHVRTGPDGRLYVITSNGSDGVSEDGLYAIEPV